MRETPRFLIADLNVGATPKDVGQGVQPQPRELHRAHTVSERLGEPQAIFRPSEKRGAHALVEQRGQGPAPGR